MLYKQLSVDRANELFYYKDNSLYYKVTRSSGSVKDTKAGTKTSDGRYKLKINRIEYLLHRVIWMVVNKEVPIEIDHIDGNPLNNNIDNLRNVTHKENMRNRKLHKSNTSGIIGVDFHMKRDSFRARSPLGHLGWFKSKVLAAEAALDARVMEGFHQNHGRIA